MSDQITTLKEQMLKCVSCDLCKTRTNVVFGEGPSTPKIMIVGEAPGEDEDLAGKPFIGAAGQKLDKIISFLGVQREDIYITNSVLCRPPNNRNPLPEELEACRWRLELQIKLLKPKLIVVLGRVAMQTLLRKPFKGPLSQFFFDSPKVIEKYPDGWMRYQTDGHESLVLCSYHPSYLLRSPIAGYKAALPHWNRVKGWIHDGKA